MASILIMSSDEKGEIGLTASLKARGHSVSFRDWRWVSSSTRAEIGSQVDVVIFDVTSLRGR
jgi:hypothetical protein